jgi:hypothetical protein
LAETMTDELTLSAVRMAIRDRQPAADLVHHSDRGGQYASARYLDARGLLWTDAVVLDGVRRGICGGGHGRLFVRQGSDEASIQVALCGTKLQRDLGRPYGRSMSRSCP